VLPLPSQLQYKMHVAHDCAHTFFEKQLSSVILFAKKTSSAKFLAKKIKTVSLILPKWSGASNWSSLLPSYDCLH
jgi:hypothetical protein